MKTPDETKAALDKVTYAKSQCYECRKMNCDPDNILCHQCGEKSEPTLTAPQAVTGQGEKAEVLKALDSLNVSISEHDAAGKIAIANIRAALLQQQPDAQGVEAKLATIFDLMGTMKYIETQARLNHPGALKVIEINARNALAKCKQQGDEAALLQQQPDAQGLKLLEWKPYHDRTGRYYRAKSPMGYYEISAEGPVYLYLPCCSGRPDGTFELIESAKAKAQKHFEDEIRPYITATRPQQPAQDGWKPIETAPRDGTWILVGIENSNMNPSKVCSYGASLWRLEGPYEHQDPDTITIILDMQPTHWQPLPAPPAGLKEGG